MAVGVIEKIRKVVLFVTINIPAGANQIIKQLQKAGFKAYVVGGCVRDSLLGKEPHDWDICTNALPAEVEQCFSDHRIIETGIKHGTVTVLCDDEAYEVTTYRTDGEYTDHRRPDHVEFVSSLQADLARRDFTINAMAYNKEKGLVDMFGGLSDLNAGIIRCVGNPDDRFQEDALRILRAIRFASTYGFAVDEHTSASIHKNANLLAYVARERILVEICKTLAGKGSAEMLMAYKDVFSLIIPELKPCIGFDQNNAYHSFDVYDHIAHAVGSYAGTDNAVNLALLLHDIGKPLCYTENETGGHFPEHSKISCDLAKPVLDSLKVDNQTRHDVLELVLFHDAEIKATPKTVRRWLNRIGETQFYRLLDVRRADIAAHSEKNKQKHLDECDAVEAVLEEVLKEKQCFTMKDLHINGNDIMDLGLTQGKEVGMILNWLLDEVIEGRLENRHHDLKMAAEHKIYGIE